MMLQDDDLLKIAVELLAGVVPMIILIVRLHLRNVDRFHELAAKSMSNGEQLVTIRKQLDHQDECIDGMKKDMVETARGGTDLVKEVELNRVRQAISSEITRTIGNFETRFEELRERLRALEARAMRNARSDE